MNSIPLFARPPLMALQTSPPGPLIHREEIAPSEHVPDLQMADAKRNEMDVDCQPQECQHHLKRKRFDEQGFVTPPSSVKRQRTDPFQFEDVDPIRLLPQEHIFFPFRPIYPQVGIMRERLHGITMPMECDDPSMQGQMMNNSNIVTEPSLKHGPIKGLKISKAVSHPPHERVKLNINEVMKGFKFPKTTGNDVYALNFDALKAWMKNTLEDAKDVTQEEKEAFYARIAVLLSAEISLQKYELPYLHNGCARYEPVITEKVAADSFRDLIRLGDYDFTKHYEGMQSGIKMSAFYMNGERVKASGIIKSPLEQWHDEKLRLTKISRVFKYSAKDMKSYRCIGLPLITAEFLTNAPGQFRPAALFDVLNYLKQSNVGGNITKILDLCAGWGDRLVGAMAATNRFKVVRYIGTDPNKDLTPCYKKIFDACSKVLNQEMKTPWQFTAKIYDKPMEDLSEEELNPEGVQSDLMITSPPFFDYEKYKDHGLTQSSVRYPKLEEWLDKFLYKLVDQAKKGVRNHGIIAIHFSTALYESKKVSDLLKANMEIKLRHVTDLAYIAKTKRRKTKGYEGEKFFIYQKVEPLQPQAGG